MLLKENSSNNSITDHSIFIRENLEGILKIHIYIFLFSSISTLIVSNIRWREKKIETVNFALAHILIYLNFRLISCSSISFLVD